MAKAVEQLANGMTVGHASLTDRIYQSGLVRKSTVKESVHDGDTVTVDPVGNLSVRLLGVDAPEVSFTLPDSSANAFVSIKNERFVTFLTDPFAAHLPPFDPPLPAALEAHLRGATGPTCAANHDAHGAAAQRAFEKLVEDDMAAAGDTTDSVRFFLTFAHEILDRYGRFLGFINRDYPEPPRPLSYNERLFQQGMVVPYFIWPNINPFRRQPGIVNAVPPPNQLIRDSSLDDVRKATAMARAGKLGVFASGNELQLLPFELRFLARASKNSSTGQLKRRGPDRWVIDLSKASDTLLPPERYIEIPNWEDRLFVPAEFVALFVEKGWRRG